MMQLIRVGYIMSLVLALIRFPDDAALVKQIWPNNDNTKLNQNPGKASSILCKYLSFILRLPLLPSVIYYW